MSVTHPQGMEWVAKTIGDQTFDLSHMHPFLFNFVVPAKGKNPERIYRVNVEFSMHCFTRGKRVGEVIAPELLYADNREERVFDVPRYNLSRGLVDIIRDVGARKLFFAKNANFFTVEVVTQGGETQEYTIFFTVSRAGKKGRLNLYVQSAYIPDGIPRPQRRKPIKFQFIAYKTMAKEEIKPPR